MRRKTINEQIEDLCAARGITFKPWQLTPWECDGPTPPENCSSMDRDNWPKAWRLRKQLLEEINARRILF